MKRNPRIVFSLVISAVLFLILLVRHEEVPAEVAPVVAPPPSEEMKVVPPEVVYQITEGAFWPVWTGSETCRYQLVEPILTDVESQELGVQFHEVFDPDDGEYYVGATPYPGFPKHTLLRTWDRTLEAVTGDPKLAVLLSFRDKNRTSSISKPDE